MTAAAIADATGLGAASTRRALQTLACGKVRLLVKEPMSADVNDGDVFSLNLRFASKTRKVRVSAIAAAKETEAEKTATRAAVDEDRKSTVEAAIVRIMKSRRRLDHNVLIADVTSQLAPRFAVAPAVVKKLIEGLIVREFLQRCPDNMKVYEYLA